MSIDFYKYHALGNDYLVIDPQKTKIKLNEEVIRLICHRNFGVGSDGILYGPILEKGVVSLKIFNPDGSEAEKSGNGIRIFSRYLIEAGYVKETKFQLKTLGGNVDVQILNKEASRIKVGMGKVTFQSELIPIKGPAREVVNEELNINGKTFKVTCLSIGNPHCVIPLSEISESLAKEMGPHVEKHSSFPKRINMQLLKVRDRKNIEIQIWERGAGYTLASGSSSCAAASAAYRLGLVDKNIQVHMPGGVIDIEISDNGVHMTGDVSSVFEGNFTKEFNKSLKAIS